MREPPPHLALERLAAGLLTHYGLSIAELTFLPLGYDALAWVYQAQSVAGQDYFVKVRARPTNEAGLLVPRYLREQGIAQIVAPLPTLAGQLWTRVDRYALSLYPFVVGTSGMRAGGLSERQWREFGAILQRIHALALPPLLERALQREQFTCAGIQVVEQLDATIDTSAFRGVDDPSAQALATFWRARRREIRGLVQRVEELGKQLARVALPCVLTHGDMHTGNVHVDVDGHIWIVDWDETALAPKERDLMFVVGGIHTDLVGAHAEQAFFSGYGPTTMSSLALAYYRYAWAVQDIGEFGQEVLRMPDVGATARRDALDTLIALFDPKSIVAIAQASSLTGA
ncbi:MAG: aminoglycoside O-phosphotransferase APH(9)-Ia [Ktedonobacterales bacterium]